ncbi:MAG: hypothetical protein HC848_10335 [Limnobacter sp.]|nr:hypothetical protein [Limnobacter sp.]
MLQRSQPVVNALNAQGDWVTGWVSDALGDPHSISFQGQAPTTSQNLWITDIGPAPARRACVWALPERIQPERPTAFYHWHLRQNLAGHRLKPGAV